MHEIQEIAELTNKPANILCLDDEPGVLKSLTRLLRQYNFTSTVCSEGEEALKKMAETIKRLDLF